VSPEGEACEVPCKCLQDAEVFSTSVPFFNSTQNHFWITGKRASLCFPVSPAKYNIINDLLLALTKWGTGRKTSPKVGGFDYQFINLFV
jgi:hypothetical protein